MRWVPLLGVLTGCVVFPHGDQTVADAPASSIDSRVVDGLAGYQTPKVVQKGSMSTPIGSSVVVPLSQPVAAGSVVIVGATTYSGTASVQSIADDAGTPYVTASARATVPFGSTEIWYAVAPRPGATQVTVTLSTGFGGSAWVIEVSGLDATAPTVAVAPDQSPGAMIAAPQVHAQTPNAFVFSLVELPAGNVLGVHAGSLFALLSTGTTDSGAYMLAPMPGLYGATWDQSGAITGCSSTAAFAAAKL